MERSRYLSRQIVFGKDGQIASPWESISQNTIDEAKALLGDDQGMPVVSHERFLGYPFGAGLDAPVIRDRIREFCPNAKILMVVREQQALIQSSYIQYIRRGGTMPLKRALTQKYDWRMPFFNKAYFYYHLAADGYMNAFGRENVLVLPFEMLQREPETFVSSIYDFCGMEGGYLPEAEKRENKSNALAVEMLLRRFNVLLSKNSLNAYSPIALTVSAKKKDRMKEALSRLVPDSLEKRTKKRIRDDIRSALPPEAFRRSNTRLSELTGTDFGAYGYPL